MPNDDLQELERRSGFMLHPDTSRLFSKLDDDLRSSVHIQNIPFQRNLYTYLEENIDTLTVYYEIAHQLLLTFQTSGFDKYYFIDFPNPPSRGGIGEENRHFMEDEHVVVGFLLYKIMLSDGRVDIDSLDMLMKVIDEDYPDLHPMLYSKIGQVRDRKQPGDSGRMRLKTIIGTALNEFIRMAWFSRDGDYITPLPAFNRLAVVFGKEINDAFEKKDSSPDAPSQ